MKFFLDSQELALILKQAGISIHNPWLFSIMAGIVFGAWPYYLDRAGLVGINSPAAFCHIQSLYLLFILLLIWGVKGGDWKPMMVAIPLIVCMAFYAWLFWETKTTKWDNLLFASFFSSTGLICVSQMLAKATNETRSSLLAVMGIVSVGIVATVYLVQNPKDFVWQRLLAYPSAVVTIYLFHKKW